MSNNTEAVRAMKADLGLPASAPAPEPAAVVVPAPPSNKRVKPTNKLAVRKPKTADQRLELLWQDLTNPKGTVHKAVQIRAREIFGEAVHKKVNASAMSLIEISLSICAESLRHVDAQLEAGRINGPTPLSPDLFLGLIKVKMEGAATHAKLAHDLVKISESQERLKNESRLSKQQHKHAPPMMFGPGAEVKVYPQQPPLALANVTELDASDAVE